MIEVEKKFLLDDIKKSAITEGAIFVGEKTFTDTYYDTPDYSLTRKDIWLRMRDGKFELKTPLHHGVDRLADQYEEWENEHEIKNALGVSLGVSIDTPLFKSLEKNNMSPFCTLTTTRTKYKLDPFVIDLDRVMFEKFTYTIGEIELMVQEKSEIEEAVQKILTFATHHGLTIAPVRGKVAEYLRREKREHYKALIKAGVFKDDEDK